MKKIGRRSLGILVLAVLVAVVVGTYLATKTSPPRVESAYPPAPPILIDEDADFTRVDAGSGCECVRAGSGTEQDPYIISEWLLNASDVNGLAVFGTKSHFIVRRVRVEGNGISTGIRLKEVENGAIEDSFIANNLIAVYILRSRNLEFANNTLEDNVYGIHLEASDANRVSSNLFDGTAQVAIFVRGSENLVRANRVHGAYGGINIDGTAGQANENVVTDNAVSATLGYGIGLWRAARNTVRNNFVKQNEGIGIILTENSVDNSVEANVVTQNREGGILVNDGASRNTIKDNTVEGNGDGVRFFDLADRSSGNTWKNNVYDTKSPETLE